MSHSASLIIIISIVIAVLAFVALVIFLVCTLVFVMRSLKRTEQLIEHSNGIAADVERKLHAFDPLFVRIHEFGEMMNQKSESIRKLPETSERQESRVEAIAGAVELCEWALVGVSLASRLFKKRR